MNRLGWLGTLLLAACGQACPSGTYVVPEAPCSAVCLKSSFKECGSASCRVGAFRTYGSGGSLVEGGYITDSQNYDILWRTQASGWRISGNKLVLPTLEGPSRHLPFTCDAANNRLISSGGSTWSRPSGAVLAALGVSR